MSDIPQWAKERADDLIRAEPHGIYVNAFARYIAEHEQQPVDPLWQVAMDLTKERGWNGDSPILPMVKFAHAALRRGIELGKSS